MAGILYKCICVYIYVYVYIHTNVCAGGEQACSLRAWELVEHVMGSSGLMPVCCQSWSYQSAGRHTR